MRNTYKVNNKNAETVSVEINIVSSFQLWTRSAQKRSLYFSAMYLYLPAGKKQVEIYFREKEDCKKISQTVCYKFVVFCPMIQE